MVEKVHFRKEWISPEFLGRKAVLVNLSDLAAMGAKPYCCLLGLTLPGELKESFFERFINGFCGECERNLLTLVGGDLSAGHEIHISVTVIGIVDSGSPVYRSSAMPGDHIFLIGIPGRSSAGLYFLKNSSLQGLETISNEVQLARLVGNGPELEWIRSHLLPENLLQPAGWLRKNGLVNSMIDVSDGLGNDLYHILEESGLSAELHLEQLPAIQGISDRSRWQELALDGPGRSMGHAARLR